MKLSALETTNEPTHFSWVKVVELTGLDTINQFKGAFSYFFSF